ncbi:hypothetical protein [Hymenobacter properus]|uniref:Uncharacterized protein n=1 Tax=Hymenobacter properus TaxID=2791026 RepID=A0A931FKR6_9BACT|nr:hypothetical protein [Hymenobacter properus]MBF9143368.1 hypothetical protein [Hymenobacter properus]MBR7722179.1 hypothetical protein [Microvirga sp. SRT04]
MKASLFSLLAAAALFTSSTAFAAEGPFDHRYDGRDDRNSKDFNYGYDRNHRVTAAEKARWEAAHRNDRRDDDHFDRNQNYGFDRNHRVTAQEKARWEAQQRAQREAQERAQREAQFRAQREAQERARYEATHRQYGHR